MAITDKVVMAELAASAAMPKGRAAPPASADGTVPSPPADGAAPPTSADGAKPSMPEGGAKPPTASGGAKASLGDSPLAILVYRDDSTASPAPDFDCGLAVQNMYLAAVSLGYGAKIVSSPTMALNGENHDAICEKLGIDPPMNAVAVLLIGKTEQGADGVSGASVRASLEEKTRIIE